MGDLGRMTKTSVEKTKIAVLGMGHVGLPTALGLAELGWEVIGADSNPETIATSNQANPGSTNLILNRFWRSI